MIKHWSIPVSALALAAGSLAIATPTMAATTAPAAHTHFVPGGVLFKPATGLGARGAVRAGGKIEYSSNWSGYAVTGGTYTSVSATWVQNAGTCSSSDTDTDMSPWVGIDGYSSSSVEQTGTSVDCSGSSKTYYAWYEMYPANFARRRCVRFHTRVRSSSSARTVRCQRSWIAFMTPSWRWRRTS